MLIVKPTFNNDFELFMNADFDEDSYRELRFLIWFIFFIFIFFTLIFNKILCIYNLL